MNKITIQRLDWSKQGTALYVVAEIMALLQDKKLNIYDLGDRSHRTLGQLVFPLECAINMNLIKFDGEFYEPTDSCQIDIMNGHIVESMIIYEYMK